MIYALWHGGSSYTPSSIEEKDLERFRSIVQARETFRERAETSGGCALPTYYTDKDNTGTAFPAVDETTSMDVFKYDPREVCDPYPDFRFTLGPKGGIRVEVY